MAPELTAEQDPLLNAELGGCRIESCLGRGGMAVVYTAHHIALDKKVAVKVLSPSLASDPDFVQRFLREAQSAGKLEHPRIVQVLNVGEQDGHYYIVMQLVQGETLEARMKRVGRFTAPDAIRIVRDIAQGLAAAHAHGIIHRDIKPANILIDDENSVRITDFGLAREIKPAKDVTIDGSFLGTPAYCSPEQAQGHELDHRTDLYSLGILFYQILEGVVPFASGTAMDVVMAHIHKPAPTMKHADPELGAIVMKLMQKNPADRYSSADVLVRDLGALLSSRKPTVRRATVTATSGSVPTTGRTPAAPPAPTRMGATAIFQTPPGAIPAPRFSAPPPKVTPLMPGTSAQIPAVPTVPPRKTNEVARQSRRMRRRLRFAFSVSSLVITALAFFLLGGYTSEAMPHEPVETITDGALAPFSPKLHGFMLNLGAAIACVLFFFISLTINRTELSQSPEGPMAVICLLGSLPLLYIGTLFVHAQGEGFARAMDAASQVFEGVAHSYSLLPLCLGILLPSLYALISFGEKPGTVWAGRMGLLLSTGLAYVYSYRWVSTHDLPPPRVDDASLYWTAVVVGIVGLGLSLTLLRQGVDGGVRVLGCFFALLGVTSAYAAGLAMATDAESILMMLKSPLSEWRKVMIPLGLPALVGGIGVVWALLLLYRNRPRQYYRKA